MWKQLQKKYLGSTIPLITLNGVINNQMVEKVNLRLKKINPSRSAALAVSINSAGGYPVQGLLISNKINQYAAKHSLKVFTFARGVATSGGYYLLSSGNHVCADSTSIVGGIGVTFSKWQFKGALDFAEIENKNISTNKNSIRDAFNSFQSLDEYQRKQIQQLCDWTREKLFEYIKKNRGNKLVTIEDISRGQIFNGQQAKQLGLIDQVGSMVQILEKYYPESQLEIDLRQKRLFQGIYHY